MARAISPLLSVTERVETPAGLEIQILLPDRTLIECLFSTEETVASKAVFSLCYGSSKTRFFRNNGKWFIWHGYDTCKRKTIKEDLTQESFYKALLRMTSHSSKALEERLGEDLNAD